MSANPICELRKPVESEKITINLGYVDLGNVDLLVDSGFYANRSDFIRTAIRNQVERYADVVKSSVAREGVELGLRHIGKADLEAAIANKRSLHLKVLGLLTIADDVPPELAIKTIASIRVLGAFHASAKIKAALADRIQS